MAAERELAIKITGDARGLGRAFGVVDREAGKLERGLGAARRGLVNLGKAAGVATVALGAAGVAMAKTAVDAASDLEESLNKSSEVFKAAGDDMKRWSQDAATSMGLSRAAALEGASSIGAMLTPMGIAPRRAADMSRSMTELAADMASFNNEDPTEMLDRIRAGLSGESEPLKRYGAVLSEARVAQFAWSNGIAQSGEQLTEQQKIMARYGLLLQDTKDQQGDFARTSDGLANAQRIASAQWQDMSAALGEAFIPAAAKALSVINNLIGQVRDRMPQIREVIGAVMARVQEVIGQAVEFVRANWPQISATAQDVFGRVRAVVMSVVATVVPIVQSLAQTIVDLAPRIRPVVEEVGRILGSLAELISAVARRIQQFWARWGDEIMAVVRYAFTTIAKIAKPLLETVRAIIETVTAAIEGDWSGVWDGLVAIARGALKTLWAVIRGAADIAAKVATELGKAVLKGLGSALKGTASAVREGVVTGLRKLGDLASAALNKGVDLGKKIVSGIVQAVKDGASAIARAVWDAIPGSGAVRDAVSGVLGFVGFSRGGMLPGVYQGRDTMLAALAPGEAVLTPEQQAMVPGGRALLGAIFRATGGAMGGHSFAAGGYVGSAYQRAVDQLGDPYGKPSRGESRTGPNSWDCSGYATYVAGVNVGGTTASAYQMSSPSRGGEAIVWGFRKSHSGGYRGGYDEHMGVRVNGRWFDAGSGGVESNSDSMTWQEVRVPRGLEGLAADGDLPDSGTATSGRGTTQPQLSDRQKLAQVLGQATGRPGLYEDRSISKWARPLVNALSSEVPDVSAGLAGTSFGGAQSRTVSRAGRAARAEARAAGKSPEEVRAGEIAEREAELKALRVNRRGVIQARAALRKKKARLLADWKKLTRKPAKTPKGRAARKKATAQIRAKLREYTAEINDLTEMIAEIAERIAELGEEAIDEQHAANYEAGQQGPDDSGGGEAGAGADDPTELDWLNLRAVQAQFTEDTGDDLAVARDLERYYERAASATSDPREKAAALQSLLAVRQQIAALTANTQALTDNTDALRGFAGSTAFAYRGQDNVLRSLAPPSSDRPENVMVGA